jgi:hypothetical protein
MSEVFGAAKKASSSRTEIHAERVGRVRVPERKESERQAKEAALAEIARLKTLLGLQTKSCRGGVAWARRPSAGIPIPTNKPLGNRHRSARRGSTDGIAREATTVSIERTVTGTPT